MPELVVILEQLQRGRQPKMVPMIGEQLEAKAMNGAEEDAIKHFQTSSETRWFQNFLPGPPLHFIGRAVGEGHHRRSRQYFSARSKASAIWTIRSVMARVLPEPAAAIHGEVLLQFS